MHHETLMLYENGNVLTVSMLLEKNLKVCLDNDNKRYSDNANNSKKYLYMITSMMNVVQK